MCTESSNPDVVVMKSANKRSLFAQSNAATQLAPQNNQLMSNRRVLSFKPQLRLEWRGQDGKSETERPIISPV